MAQPRFTGRGFFRAAVYTVIALVGLGLVKQAMPDVWSKVPGLNQF